AAGSLDMIFGWNYGYLRRPPSQPSLLDYLGPWPWYILSLELIALCIFILLTLPFRKSGRQDHRIDGMQVM
ncbi:MAG: TIGR02206 family membrane protein, partial [Acidobacteria bacterium]|nr:TIGR02206 family membrane protein [Acidobacteriota bacterium]